MTLSLNDPYAAKAAFFDDQVQADWAVQPYGPEEYQKIGVLFTITGSLAGLRLIEPGCGTGRLTEVLAAKVGPKGHVVALDISPRMVAAARRRLAGFGNVEILQGPVEEKIGYEEYFDLVICHQVFPHFADPAGVLAKLTAMLKPGGRLVVSHFISSTEINAVHLKAGTAVARDRMPSQERMQRWCALCNLSIDFWRDGEEGYLLSARMGT